jgi:carotenoid cleavage dioxygenase-like enzyme
VFTRFDTETGECQSWTPGPRCFCEELIFVPGPGGAQKEDDGALLGMIFDAETLTSSLVVRCERPCVPVLTTVLTYNVPPTNHDL